MGWLVMGSGSGFGILAYYLLRWLNHMRLAGIHGAVAVSALTVAVCLFFRGEALLAVSGRRVPAGSPGGPRGWMTTLYPGPRPSCWRS